MTLKKKRKLKQLAFWIKFCWFSLDSMTRDKKRKRKKSHLEEKAICKLKIDDLERKNEIMLFTLLVLDQN